MSHITTLFTIILGTIGALTAAKSRRTVETGCLGIKFYFGKPSMRKRQNAAGEWVREPRIIAPGLRWIFPGIMTLRTEQVDERKTSSEVLAIEMTDRAIYDIKPVMFYRLDPVAGIIHSICKFKDGEFDSWVTMRFSTLVNTVLAALPSTTQQPAMLADLEVAAREKFAVYGITVLEVSFADSGANWPTQLCRNGFTGPLQPLEINDNVIAMPTHVPVAATY